MRRVYLDNAASMPLLPVAKQAMKDTFEVFGNASSLHFEGREAKQVISNAKAEIAKLIGASSDEIILTSGGSEGNNMVINSFYGQRIAISAIEHASILEPFLHVAGENMNCDNILPVDEYGQIKMDVLKNLFTEKNKSKIALASVALANNEIGTIQDIAKISDIVHKSGALIHTDACQAIGKMSINVNNLGVDYLTLSAHKIGGPKGVGAVYVRHGSIIKPLIFGGHQQNSLRAGTEDVVSIAGFGAAVKYIKGNIDNHINKLQVLRDKLCTAIIKQIPNVAINGDIKKTLPNILNFSFTGVEGESVMLMLDAAGIAVSTGSACATTDIRPSRVLAAINADPELSHNSIRFSLGFDTTESDIDYVIKKLLLIIKELRKISSIKETSY